MNQNSIATKDSLRRQLLHDRETMPIEARRAAEKNIADALSAESVLHGWSHVAVFLPWRGEPDLMATWRAWHARGIQLALPVVMARDQPLVMRQWQPGLPMIQDAMGLAVPGATADNTEVVNCDTWIIPSVGVDRDGARLGAGKGFYDRTIADLPRPWPRLIGVCFSKGLVQTRFGEPHDLRLHACITDAGVHRFPESGHEV